MSTWPATKAKQLYAALLRIGWRLKKQVGFHRKLERQDWRNFTFCFHDSVEIGPAALAKISKETGLRPEDLRGYQLLMDCPPMNATECEFRGDLKTSKANLAFSV